LFDALLYARRSAHSQLWPGAQIHSLQDRNSMLIIFTTKVRPDVVMFGDIAGLLLRAMGENEQPPGILRGENIKIASDKLRAHLQMFSPENTRLADAGTDKPEEEIKEQLNYVGLKKRALPLLELLDAAYRKNSDVIWR
jgi:hypothetical protein